MDLTLFVRRAADRAILTRERIEQDVSLTESAEGEHAEALSQALLRVGRRIAEAVAEAALLPESTL